MHVATGRVKRMSAGFASMWGATPATHTKQHTFATCTISVWPHARLLEKMNSKRERNAAMVWALAELLAISGGCEGCNLRGLHSCQDIVSRKLCWIKKADEMIKRRKAVEDGR